MKFFKEVFMTDTEKKVFDIWAEVFERDDFGIDDDFFEIGGDSIKAMKIYMFVTEKVAEVNIDDFFEALTIRSIAEAIDEKYLKKQ
jgi:acyl carrier protein